PEAGPLPALLLSARRGWELEPRLREAGTVAVPVRRPESSGSERAPRAHRLLGPALLARGIEDVRRCPLARNALVPPSGSDARAGLPESRRADLRATRRARVDRPRRRRPPVPRDARADGAG